MKRETVTTLGWMWVTFLLTSGMFLWLGAQSVPSPINNDDVRSFLWSPVTQRWVYNNGGYTISYTKDDRDGMTCDPSSVILLMKDGTVRWRTNSWRVVSKQ